MKKLIRRCILVLAFGLCFCGKDVNGPDEGPEPPKLWPNPHDNDLIEKGIDAIPEADAIQIDWDLVNDKNVEQILLYRRAEGDDKFSLLKRLGRKDTAWIDSDSIKLHTRYYYYACSLDRDNRKGVTSDTVDYMLLDKAYNLNATLESQPSFRWQIRSYSSEKYIIKVFNSISGEKVWFATVESDYSNHDEEVQYNSDGSALLDNLSPEQRYSWRVDKVGLERNSGSESNWRHFSPP